MKTQDKRLMLFLNVVKGGEDFKKLYTKNGHYVRSECGRFSWKRDKERSWVGDIRKLVKKENFVRRKKGDDFITITNKGIKKLNELNLINRLKNETRKSRKKINRNYR